MKYIDEFRDAALARHIAGRIAAEVKPDHQYRFMEFCGGHTHAISRYGVLELLPANVRMIHGPGVRILPLHTHLPGWPSALLHHRGLGQRTGRCGIGSGRLARDQAGRGARPQARL